MRFNFKVGDKVAFSQACIRRTGADCAAARGTVTAVKSRPGLGGALVSVDWHGTWVAHEDGGTVRTIPAVNLTPILRNGAVFGD